MMGKRRTDLDPTFLKGVERTTERRGARVVEWAGFENRCAFTGTVGSNPTLSASFYLKSPYTTSAIWFAKNGGTAFPTCTYCCVLLPTK